METQDSQHQKELQAQEDLVQANLPSFAKGLRVTAYDTPTYKVLTRALNGEGKSYIHNIIMAILECREKATNKEEFIKLMLAKGIQADWSDQYTAIMFTDLALKEAGKKRCHITDWKLSKYYNVELSKETLEECFAYNRTKSA